MDKLQRLLDLKQKNKEKEIDLLLLKNNLGKGKPNIITSFNLFETPLEIAKKMASLVDFKGKTVLEPSVGLGRLLTYISGAKEITAIDISNDCLGAMYRNFSNVKIIKGNFLELELPKFDIAIMNPPFKNKEDIKHILKAKELCKEVVFLCFAGAKREEILKPLCCYWELLPKNSFKKSGTNVDIFLGYIKE